MTKALTLSSALEDYLETISRLVDDSGYARARDIAHALSVHKSTVTAALRSLSDKELINYSPYEMVTLTEAGQDLASDIIRGHKIIRRFLTEVLQVQLDVAEANACRIEHAIDPQVLDRLLTFIQFIHDCPRCGSDLMTGFRNLCVHGKLQHECEGCISRCLHELQQSDTARDTSTTHQELSDDVPE